MGLIPLFSSHTMPGPDHGYMVPLRAGHNVLMVGMPLAVDLIFNAPLLIRYSRYWVAISVMSPLFLRCSFWFRRFKVTIRRQDGGTLLRTSRRRIVIAIQSNSQSPGTMKVRLERRALSSATVN